MDGAMTARPRATIRELALLFLRLGVTAFGGPTVHIAMMEDEVVRRRGWLSREAFLDLLGAANLIPGPSSTELAIFIGYEQAGWAGLLVGGVTFIAPAAAIVTALAWAYVRFGSLPALQGLLYGVKPVVVAVVAQALWGLAPKAMKGSAWLAAVGALAAAGFALGEDALAVLAGAGVLALLPRMLGGRGEAGASFVLAPAKMASLFWTFLKAGSAVVGSGYVLLAFLRADLVERLRWITEGQLLDAVAIGQVTPGPVFTTATFIGYVVGARDGTAAGVCGAAVATAGIFLPGFVFVPLVRPLVTRIRGSRAAAFLDGVNVAALGIMAVVAAQLGRSALVDPWTVAIGVAGAVALIALRANTAWLVLGGAALGALVHPR